MPVARKAEAGQEDDTSRMCGVCGFRPRVLQAFARPQLFTLLYSAVGILQSAHFYYFFAIMSTLQRRYGLSSWSVTVVLFADSASPFLVSFLVGHYSRMVSKPLLMFCAILALVVSCGISALPFFLYGPGLGAVDFKDSQEQLSSCQFDRTPLAESICEDQGMPESVVVTAVLFAANCFYGAAYSVLFISGSTYVDDSVKKKNSPLHFATVAILKLAGPTLGYALGSVCLRYYEDPRLEPAIGRTDPRWVGAWWLGYVALGACLVLTAPAVLLFPHNLSPASSPTTTDPAGRACTGPVLMVTNVLGLGIGGLALHTFRPRPRLVTLYTTLCDLLKLGCFVACAFIGCQAIRLAGTVDTVVGRGSSIQLPCSETCNCTTISFQPLCDPVNGTVFFSPCHAGCRRMSAAESGRMSFDDCSCLPGQPPISWHQQQHQPLEQEAPYLGLCSGDTCRNVVAFIALSSLVGFISRTTTIGHTVVGLRCVARHEKAMALGVQEGLSSIFTYVPYPILYGAVFDSACLVWEDKCGRPGVCWIYDTDWLRYAYHGLSVAILIVALLFEVGLVYHSNRMTDFYSDAADPTTREQQDKPPSSQWPHLATPESAALVSEQRTNRLAGLEEEDEVERVDQNLLGGAKDCSTCGCVERSTDDEPCNC
ncbi:hypothetical protein HPB48_006323 [Haemaphysalis longicornis]|uniref:Kazal-like domain-containing protein n=1 Tax=Haemaphysalis longicornis TaxID=44386 RepID=A0A9J6G8D2_HAELO|nr:hypothetical protein HPB48_006323 [Haemaphysalis longicornis]